MSDTCTRCGDYLSQDDIDSPVEGDDGPICWSCELELNWDDCSVCDERVQNEELESEIGQLIVLFEECGEEFPAGYYRVLQRPFYCQSMVGSGWFFPGAIERVADLDKEAAQAAEGAWCPSGAMCNACRKRVEGAIAERGALTT